MPAVDNNFYNEIGDKLNLVYKDKPHKYFTHQRYYPIEDFLEPVTPMFEEFYGPKVMTILVLSRPYAWLNPDESSWPNPVVEASKQRIIAAYKKWVQYKVLVWADYTLALRIFEDNPGDNFVTRMNYTIAVFYDFFAELEPYGFKYMGPLDTQVEAEYFQPYIDDFLKD